jgi:lysophospholipase L1-like esterase
MKIKMFLFIIFTVLFIFLINLANSDKEIYYVNIDTTNSLTYNKDIYNKLKKNNLEKYVNYFSKKDYRTTDLINDIEDNIKINNQTIQNALIKADILTIYVGINDINYKINNNKEELYEYTDEIFEDIEKLFKLIRLYSKEKIYVIGYKNTKGISYNEYFNYVNKVLKSICNEYNIVFIDINNNENIIDKIFTK